MDKEPTHNARNTGHVGLIPGMGRSPGEGNGNSLQYSCLGNPMDRGAWRATGHGVTKSWTQLKSLSKGAIPLIGCPSGCGPNWESPGKIDNMTSFKSHRKMNDPPSPREYSIKSPRLANGRV